MSPLHGRQILVGVLWVHFVLMLMKLIGLGLLILFVQGCIKSEYHEVMLYVEVIMPGMDERYSAEDIRFLDIMSGRMFRREDKHYIPSAFEI